MVTMTRTPRPEPRDADVRVAVSTVIFSVRRDAHDEPVLSLPPVRRTRDPFDGRSALPGGTPLYTSPSPRDS